MSGPLAPPGVSSQVADPELRGTRFRDHAPQALALDVAENLLLMDELADLFTESPMQLGRADFNYPHNSIGEPLVRASIAELLSETWRLDGRHTLNTDQVLCTPGASAALRLHARARLQAGDTVLVPAPYWQMFDRIYRDAGVSLVPLPIALDAHSSVDLAKLQALHADLLARGAKPRLLLLTNPHNPLGIVESRDSLEALLSWVLTQTQMEIVSDEIYAHSIFDPSVVFVSALALNVSLQYPERVHVVWGFAKDFGLSGWMAGVLLTRSRDLHETITQQFARFSPFDGLKNRVLRRLLCERVEPRHAPQELLRLLPQRLQSAQHAVAEVLRREGIGFEGQSVGAPFFWLDLRAYLDADLTHAPHPAACVLDGPEDVGFDAREGRLQRYLACVANVVLLRGQTMHAEHPGFFRLCFTAEPITRITLALTRMGLALRALS